MEFLKDFVAPVIVAVVVYLLVAQSKLDTWQRVYLVATLTCFALFLSRTWTIRNRSTSGKHASPTVQTGNATTSGNNSPAVTGNGNTISYGQNPKPGQKAKQKE